MSFIPGQADDKGVARISNDDDEDVSPTGTGTGEMF